MWLPGRCIGIAGGGVGGLAAAVALQRRGADVIVFERARRHHQGIALLVWGNAMRALASLGVADDLLAVAAPIDRTQVRTSTGKVLSELPIGEWSRRAEMPSVALFRRDLLAALAARLAPGTVREGADVVSFEQDSRGVRVQLASGREERVDALIGADGLGSVIRAQLIGDEVRALEQQAWVGWVDVPVETGVASATIGRGPRFWYAPLAGGAFWYATINRVVGDRRELLREAFAGWHDPVPELIERTRPEDAIATQIRHRAPAPQWGTGLVTLLGDAAHPSTPDLGQGACQAIESAAVLAACLECAGSLEAGLRAYEQARMDRTATISRLCWMTSVNSTLETPLLCRLRDAAIQAGLQMVARAHLEWILAGASS